MPDSVSLGTKVFISYRRDDAAAFAGRIYDRLRAKLGRSNVFIDVDNIPPGLDFVKILSEQVNACDALILIIGKGWMTAVDEQNRRRLDKPEDFVRIELEAALGRDILVVPVLVDGAIMPHAVNLPDSIKPVVNRHSLEVSHARFDADVRRLIRALTGKSTSGTRRPRAAPSPISDAMVAEVKPGPSLVVASPPIPSSSLAEARNFLSQIVTDTESLGNWLENQSAQVATIIASRAALRVAPLVDNYAQASFVFRACALARVAGKYPSYAPGLSAAAHFAMSNESIAQAGNIFKESAGSFDAARSAAHVAACVASAAAITEDDRKRSAVERLETGAHVAPVHSVWRRLTGMIRGLEDSSPQMKRDVLAAVASAQRSASLEAKRTFEREYKFITKLYYQIDLEEVTESANLAMWSPVNGDALAVASIDASGLADLPIWYNTPPDWWTTHWSALRAALPPNEDWEVWLTWYEERVRGGSRGEIEEAMFASVPEDVWKQGSPAANAWIHEHLMKN